MTKTVTTVSEKLAALVPMLDDTEKLLGEEHQITIGVEFINPTTQTPFGIARIISAINKRAVCLIVVEESSQVCLIKGIRNKDPESEQYFESGELNSVALSKTVAEYIFDKEI